MYVKPNILFSEHSKSWLAGLCNDKAADCKMWIHEPLARCLQKPQYKCYCSNQSRMCEPIDHSTFPTSGNSEFHTRMCFEQLAFPIGHCCAHGVLFWITRDVAWKHWSDMYNIENRLISNLQDETGSNPASDETVFIANFFWDWNRVLHSPQLNN